MLLKKETADKLTKLLVLLLIVVISVGIIGPLANDSKFVKGTMACLDEDKEMVAGISAATLGLSFVITFFPDDVGTPIANTLADMNKFFIFIMAVIIVERLLVLVGTKLIFVYMIPLICGLFALGIVTTKNVFKKFAIKLSILSLAVVLVVPIATHFSRFVGKDYLAEVSETIDDTKNGADKMVEANEEDGSNLSFLEKVEKSFDSLVDGTSGAVSYMKNATTRLGRSIAILIVTTFVVPVLVLFFFRWLLNELFRIRLRIPDFGGKQKELVEDE